MRVLYIAVSDFSIHVAPLNPHSHWERHDIEVHWLLYVPKDSALKPGVIKGMHFHLTYSKGKLTFPFDAYRQAIALHRQYPFDLIVADDPMGSGLVGYLLKKTFSIPLLIKCHTDYFGQDDWILERFYYRFYVWLARFLLQKADKIQAVSKAVKEGLKRVSSVDDKVQVCPTPIFTSLFENIPPPKTKTTVSKLLYIGRLAEAKGITYLLDACRMILDRGKNISLRCVGDGPERRALEEKVRSLKLEDHVEFTGHRFRDELHQFCSEADIFVLPSLYEGFGKVLVEAAFCGLPIVVTDIAGAREATIPGETSILVPPKDSEKLAGAIISLLESPEQVLKMGACGWHFARERFDEEQMRANLAGLWKDAAFTAKIVNFDH